MTELEIYYKLYGDLIDCIPHYATHRLKAFKAQMYNPIYDEALKDYREIKNSYAKQK